MKQASNNINVRFLYITNMHHMEENLFILCWCCVYCYTYWYLGKWCVDALGNRFHVNFLVFSHWFMSIRISHLKYPSISVDQVIYATSIVAKYIDTVTVKTSTTPMRTIFHLIWYSPRIMHLHVMSKLRGLIGN